jgi:hypothetical protein
VNYVVFTHTLTALSETRASEARALAAAALLPATAAHPSSSPTMSKRAAADQTTAASSPSSAVASRHLLDVAKAGACAGVALSFVLSPVELIKCRMQVRLASAPRTSPCAHAASMPAWLPAGPRLSCSGLDTPCS